MIYLREAASAVLGLGLILFIINSIITTINSKVRGLIHLIIGISLTLLFALAYFLDTYIFLVAYHPRIYLMFGGTALLYTIMIPITLFRKGSREGFSFKRKISLGITDKKEYVYLVYKQGSQVFLKNKQGIVLKMKKTSFVDQMIGDINRKYNLKVPEELIKKYGVLTIINKKKEVYYCYLVDINVSLTNFGFSGYDKYVLVNMDLKRLDKQIIFRLMLEEEFNVIL
ncbi:MAG TPA: hypothetical protein VJZ51_01055 [Bacilli bacterium]|nr:hypothetical protein [Bacilli bacterium]